MHASVNNTELYFDIDGPGLGSVDGQLVERPALFLLHGGPGGDHSGFRTQVFKNLTDMAQIVYVDHRGSGRSRPADPETYTLDQNIDDIDALRQHLGLNQISILGSSYGGMVALGYAIRYPGRVDRLILVATAPSYRFMGDAQRILQERGTPEQLRVCQRLWDAAFESEDQLREYYRVMGPLYSTTFDDSQFDASWDRGIRNFEQLNAGFRSFLKSFDYIDQLHTIPCPTLVMAGAHDFICPPAQSQLIAERIPLAHLKVFARSSHSIASDEPEAFEAAVRGFLTSFDR